MKRLFLVVAFVLLGNTLSVWAAPNPVIYQATGLTPADIEPMVEQFRRDISRGGTDNGNLPGPLSIGRRETDWENPTRAAGGLVFPQKGTFFSTGPAFGLGISNDTEPLNFSNIDPSYLRTFQPFGSPRMLANVEFSGEIGSLFGVPPVDVAIAQQAYVNAIGIVFSDVDLQGSTYVRLFVFDSLELRFEVPARPGDGTLSFLGISFGDANFIYGLGVRAGNVPLAPGRRDGTLERDPFSGQETLLDLVTFDRVIFGEPALVPEPSVLSLLGIGLTMLIGLFSRRRLD